MKYSRALLVTVSLLITPSPIAGCATSSRAGADQDIFFPTWHPSGEPTPQGTLSGRLVQQDDCLLWDAGEQGVVLPLWPDTFSLKGDLAPVVDSGDGHSIDVGGQAVLGGGERSLANAEDLIGESIPSQCMASTIWMVTGLAQ
jgi:hypothetical protein